MVTAWFVEGDLISGQDEKQRRFSSVVVTSGASKLPDVPSSLPDGHKLLLIREVRLLVEFDQREVDFVDNQTK